MSLKQDAKTAVRDTADAMRATATETLQDKTTEARDSATAHADDLADATRAASAEFPDDSLVSQALRDVSGRVNSVTAQFRDKPAQEIFDDVAVFARRNPLLFLGGAALAGFAAARFLKSGSGQTHQSAAADPWTGHLNVAGESRK